LEAVGEAKSTTLNRLENKRVARAEYLDQVLAGLKHKGINLEDREVKNLLPGDLAGTFTFYGTGIKSVESASLHKPSIKLRIRMYILERNGRVIRADTTKDHAFLEIKIKNPFPEYPLSVHKYRLKMSDSDLLMLVQANPKDQVEFAYIIEELKTRAHNKDVDKKDDLLIDAMFDQIAILALADPNFIKPTIGITYSRTSKKFDEDYLELKKKKHLWSKKIYIPKTRSYEITIDQNLKAFRTDLSNDHNRISLDKYFTKGQMNNYLIASYPSDARVVEFKQPDAIGYGGPGLIKRPEDMEDVQRTLWEAFVGKLGENAIPHSRPDSGKFFHVKQFLRLQAGMPKKEGEQTMLLGPGN
jgi:hypothetical protein